MATNVITRKSGLYVSKKAYETNMTQATFYIYMDDYDMWILANQRSIVAEQNLPEDLVLLGQ